MIAENPNEQEGDELDGAKLLTAKALAECLSVSVRQAHRMNRAGLIPASLRIGGCVRWREDEIAQWLKCGAPSRSEWEQQRDTKLTPTAEDTHVAQ